LEDRETLTKYFGCAKQIILAEEAAGRIFMQKIGSKMPISLGVRFQTSANLLTYRK
jgi:hypothetical protein